MAFIMLAASLVGVAVLASPANAASPGDIAIIGVRADDIDGTIGNGNDDAFAWVPLVNLAAGAEIFFTDAGWTAGNSFRTEEGAIKYTAPAGGLAAGTVMLLEFSKSATGDHLFTASGGAGTYSDANAEIMAFSVFGVQPATPGDNIFIFEGSGASPSFIWGWKNDGPYEGDSTSNSTTALPASLTLGLNAMTIELAEDGSDDSRYVGPTSGTAPVLAAAIANPANWEKTETFPFPTGGTDLTNGTLGGGGFTVGSSNSAPSITSASGVSVAENQTSAVDVQATDDSDAEGAGLTFSMTGGADQGLFSINSGTGVVAFVAAPDFEAPGDAGGDNNYDVQVTVTDSGGLTDVQDIVITVTDVFENSAPTITSASGVSVAENQTSAIDVQATDDSDAEGAGLTFSMTGGADQGLFSINSGTGVVAFVAAPDFEAPGDAGGDNNYDVQVTVTDSGGLTDVQDIAVTVTNVNETPQITTPAVAEAAENQPIAVDVDAIDDTDSEGAGLAYSKAGGADQGLLTLDSSTGVVTFNTTPDFEVPIDAGADNTYEILVFVNDSDGATTGLLITITVTDVFENSAPTITSASGVSVAENQTSAVDVQATDDSDAEGAGLTFSMTGGADQGLFSINSGTGVVTFIAAPDFEAPGDAGGDNIYDVQVTVTDSGGLTDVQDIAVTVTNVNESPVLAAIGAQSVEEGQLLSTVLSASDPDGDGLRFSVSGLPVFCSVADLLNGTGSLGCFPRFIDAGSYDITLTVTDNGSPALSDSETITVTVVDTNDAPIVDAGPDQTVAIPNPVGLTGIASDDGRPNPPGALTTSWSVVSGPGTVTFDDATSVTSPATFSAGGVFTLRLTVSDGQLSSSDDVVVTVENPLGCTIVGTNGNDTLVGTGNDDVICGFGGNDKINGLAGNDTILGGDGNDLLEGDGGNDTIDGGAGSDKIFGGGGNDIMSSPSGVNTFNGQGGNDTINGGGGNDTIDGAGGRDTIFGNGGDDTLRGGSGGDTINGGAGNDVLSGGGGNDKLRDAAGDDQLFGQGGKDSLRDLVGTNVLDGGPGNDQCTTSGGTAAC